jgi:hypothetical protein
MTVTAIRKTVCNSVPSIPHVPHLVRGVRGGLRGKLSATKAREAASPSRLYLEKEETDGHARPQVR